MSYSQWICWVDASVIIENILHSWKLMRVCKSCKNQKDSRKKVCTINVEIERHQVLLAALLSNLHWAHLLLDYVRNKFSLFRLTYCIPQPTIHLPLSAFPPGHVACLLAQSHNLRSHAVAFISIQFDNNPSVRGSRRSPSSPGGQTRCEVDGAAAGAAVWAATVERLQWTQCISGCSSGSAYGPALMSSSSPLPLLLLRL